MNCHAKQQPSLRSTHENMPQNAATTVLKSENTEKKRCAVSTEQILLTLKCIEVNASTQMAKFYLYNPNVTCHMLHSEFYLKRIHNSLVDASYLGHCSLTISLVQLTIKQNEHVFQGNEDECCVSNHALNCFQASKTVVLILWLLRTTCQVNPTCV